jgi:D-alanyl-D-alanine carboxypeptidase
MAAPVVKYALVPLFVALVACSSKPNGSPPDEVGSVEQPHADTLPQSSPCDDLDRRVSAALGYEKSSPAAIVAVRTGACGTKSYAVGDAKATSLFRVGSLTKTFVSAAVLSLIGDGKFGFDTPVDALLPDAGGFPGVTVRMLLGHTSGIFDYLEDGDIAGNPHKTRTPHDLVAAARGHGRKADPGAQLDVSNTDYILLGMIVERVTQQSLGAALHERTISRAHLSSTFLDGSDPLGGDLVKGFDDKGNDKTFAWDPSLTWAASGIVSTAADTAEWLHTLYSTNIILNAATQTALLDSPVHDVFMGSQFYGLGIMRFDVNAADTGVGYGLLGDTDGYHSVAMYFPDKDLTVVAFMDQDGAAPYFLFGDVLQAIAPNR